MALCGWLGVCCNILACAYGYTSVVDRKCRGKPSLVPQQSSAGVDRYVGTFCSITMMEAPTNTAEGCNASDNTFGPVVAVTCRGGFDFTLFFEHVFLSIVPCGLFLLAVLVRLLRLYRRKAAVLLDRLCLFKLVSSLCGQALPDNLLNLLWLG